MSLHRGDFLKHLLQRGLAPVAFRRNGFKYGFHG